MTTPEGYGERLAAEHRKRVAKRDRVYNYELADKRKRDMRYRDLKARALKFRAQVASLQDELARVRGSCICRRWKGEA